MRASSWRSGEGGGSPEDRCPGQAHPAVGMGGTRSTAPSKLTLEVITERKITFRMEY